MFVALHHSHEVIAALQPVVAVIRRRDAALAGQLTRAASSISLNLAEGAERTGRDQTHLYRVAAGSCREVRSALQVAIAWRYVSVADVTPVESLLDRQSRLLHGLTRTRG